MHNIHNFVIIIITIFYKFIFFYRPNMSIAFLFCTIKATTNLSKMDTDIEKYESKRNPKLIHSIYNMLDKYANLPLGIILIQIAHFVFCYYVSDNMFHTDAYCHYSWMRITRRVPLKDWYDNAIYTHLDYPPLAAYIHWLLSFIARGYDTAFFDNSNICTHYNEPHQEFTPEAFHGLRLAVFVANTLTYNIALPYVICSYYKAYRPLFKLIMIILFQFPTYYSLIDFGDCQINGPHYAFLILGLLEITRENFGWATLYWTLSSLYKQFTLLLAVPLAIYIVYKTYEKYNTESNTLIAKIKNTFLQCLKYASIASITIFIAFLPFLQYKGIFTRIIKILFAKRELVDTTPTFWFSAEYFFNTRNNKELEDKLILLAKFLIIPNLLFVVKMFRNASKVSDKHKFLLMYIIFGLIHFLIGTPIHAKHIMYIYFGLMFMMPFQIEYFTYLNMISAMCMFCQSFRLKNQFSAMIHGFAYIAISWLFEENNVKSLEFHEYVINEKKDKKNTLSLKLHYLIIKYRKNITAIMLFILGICLFFFGVAVEMFQYEEFSNFNPVEYVAFHTGFCALLVVLFYYLLTFTIS